MTQDDLKSINQSINTPSMQAAHKQISLRMIYGRAAARRTVAATPATAPALSMRAGVQQFAF